jgi:hypothetical protein
MFYDSIIIAALRSLFCQYSLKPTVRFYAFFLFHLVLKIKSGPYTVRFSCLCIIGIIQYIIYVNLIMRYFYHSLICHVSDATHFKVLNSIIKYNTNFKTSFCYKLCVTISFSLLHTIFFGLYWPSSGVIIG